MYDLTPIALGAVIFFFGVLTVFVAPWLKAKLGAEKTAELLKWAGVAVKAAQQLYYHMDGETRLNHALSLLEEKGYDIESQEVLDAVEAEVLKLHRALEE